MTRKVPAVYSFLANLRNKIFLFLKKKYNTIIIFSRIINSECIVSAIRNCLFRVFPKGGKKKVLGIREMQSEREAQDDSYNTEPPLRC